jgi:hypothetical protein
MVLDQNGNVGIGIMEPKTKLHLKNTAVDSAAQISFENDAQEWRFGVHGGFNDALVIYNAANSNIPFVMKTNGNIGIGTTTPDAKLVVNGTIKALQVDVVPSIIADYVFEPNYKLLPLSKVEAHIKAKKHLPNIPSEKEIKAKGSVSLGDFQMKLLEKIEELTLYTIEQEKRISKLETEIAKLKNK